MTTHAWATMMTAAVLSLLMCGCSHPAPPSLTSQVKSLNSAIELKNFSHAEALGTPGAKESIDRAIRHWRSLSTQCTLEPVTSQAGPEIVTLRCQGQMYQIGFNHENLITGISVDTSPE